MSTSEDIINQTEKLAKFISELASIRGPALYGYEREGIPASKVFSLGYAKEILDKVKVYTSLIGNIIDRYI